MPRYRPRPLAALAALIALAAALALAPGAEAQQRDLAGARDYPGIGRFAGSLITGYAAKDFDATRLQAAAFKNGKPVDERRPEGRITRIAYRTQGGNPSLLEVARNFETQLAKAGYETLLSCSVDDCGGIPFAEAVDTLPIPQMWVDGFDYRYFAGRKAASAGAPESFATVLTSRNNDAVTVQLVVTVLGAIQNKIVDAAAMAKGIGESGHIALYGIYFDTGQAVVKPDSKPTLDQIAALLRAQPALKIVIVGHTDNQGTYAYNMDLSKRRAAAVAAELAKTYAIPAARLTTDGVGYLAPVASNAGEDGRALNRRVELVGW
ncbi:MAG: OmpA family protein [Bauldia sp.]